MVPSISFPGSTGGGSNHGGSFDPGRGMVFATARNVATIGQLSAMLSSDVLPSFGKTKMPFDYYLDRDGYPCNAPPWAELFGINANTGDIVWRVPLGEYKELTAKGIPKTGTATNSGAPLATAGGVVFIGGTADGQFRAFDSMTGKELWSASPGFDVAGNAVSLQGRQRQAVHRDLRSAADRVRAAVEASQDRGSANRRVPFDGGFGRTVMLRTILAGIGASVRDGDGDRRAGAGAAAARAAAPRPQGRGRRRRRRRAQAADRGAVGGDVAQGQGVRRQGQRDRRQRSRSACSTSASSARRRAARRTRDRATVGVPEQRAEAAAVSRRRARRRCVGGQRLFDNFYWIGNTGIGAWLITSNDGYILFDTMNSEEDARDIIIPAIKKLKLDPMKIKYLVFGHNHFDHTGGGEYIQRLTGAKAVMHRDDWELYLKSTGRGGGRGRGRGARRGRRRRRRRRRRRAAARRCRR